MELYFKNEDGQLQETSLMDLFIQSLNDNDFTTSVGSFDNQDCNWVEIIQDEESKRVMVNVIFKDDLNSVDSVNVYLTPIKRVVDEENSEKLI